MKPVTKKLQKMVQKFFDVIKKRHELKNALAVRLFIQDNLEWQEKAYDCFYEVSPKLSKAIRDCGFKFLGSGASRIALGYKNLAIKIEMGYESRNSEYPGQNDNEYKSYKHISSNEIGRQLIVPVLDRFSVYGGTVLVYPKLSSYSNILSSRAKSAKKIVKGYYNRAKESVMYSLFNDTGPINMGIYAGELFYLDYNIEGSFANRLESIAKNVKFDEKLDVNIRDFKEMVKERARTDKRIIRMKSIL